jgi:Zn finger protein HypA/HybF involved in hydrogenase expression
MNLSSGICTQCKREGRYGKPLLKLCPVCNQKRLNEGKPLKKGLSKKRKITGEAKLYFHIWQSRKHECENCKINLGNEARSWYFSHIKPKGKYPELRLEESNILLRCLKCHTAYDQGTKEQFEKLQSTVNYETK